MRNIKFVGAGSGVIPASAAQRAAAAHARLVQQALDSPAVKREIEAKVKRFVQDRLMEALRRGSSGTVTIRL